jgi:hypothetical protein
MLRASPAREAKEYRFLGSHRDTGYAVHWNVTTGGMASVAKGDPANVFVDQNGYLHLRIINRRGTYTPSELFSTDKIGLGTYQWQVEGQADNVDKSTVLGLFPYGLGPMRLFPVAG